MGTTIARTLFIDDGGESRLALRTQPPDPANDGEPEPIEVVIFDNYADEEDARRVALTRTDAKEIMRFLADELGLQGSWHDPMAGGPPR